MIFILLYFYRDSDATYFYILNNETLILQLKISFVHIKKDTVRALEIIGVWADTARQYPWQPSRITRLSVRRMADISGMQFSSQGVMFSHRLGGIIFCFLLTWGFAAHINCISPILLFSCHINPGKKNTYTVLYLHSSHFPKSDYKCSQVIQEVINFLSFHGNIWKEKETNVSVNQEKYL